MIDTRLPVIPGMRGFTLMVEHTVVNIENLINNIIEESICPIKLLCQRKLIRSGYHSPASAYTLLEREDKND